VIDQRVAPVANQTVGPFLEYGQPNTRPDRRNSKARGATRTHDQRSIAGICRSIPHRFENNVRAIGRWIDRRGSIHIEPSGANLLGDGRAASRLSDPLRRRAGPGPQAVIASIGPRHRSETLRQYGFEVDLDA